MEYIIPAVSAIVVAVIEALAARDRSRAKKQAETLKRHEQQRAEETRLAMAMNSATLQLCVVTANALPAAQSSGNAVKASLFEGSGSLKTALNAAITHYNNS